MDFSRHQLDAARTTRRLGFAFFLAVVGVVLVFNVAAVLAWRLLFGEAALPYGYLLVNTLATGGLIVAGALIERQRLADDASAIVRRLRARPLQASSGALSLLERRVINIVDEMALAAHQPIPKVYLMDHEPGINALAIGLSREDAAVILTRGAVESLDRDELQGVVAHEIAHLASGDVVVNSQLAAMNFGLELVANAGREALAIALPAGAGKGRPRRTGPGLVLIVPAVLLLGVGWVGHLAALLLTAAIGRTREFHADAVAVRLTRQPRGLGNALRKISWTRQRAVPGAVAGHPAGAVGLEHALFQSDRHAGTWQSRWLATHPPLASRIAKILGRAAAPLNPKRGAADQLALSLDSSRAGAWLAASALPSLVYVADSALPGKGSPADEEAALEQLAQACSDDLAALAKAARDSLGAAAMASLLIVGGSIEPEIWPLRWRGATSHQAAIAVRLRRQGVQTIESLRWPLIELCAATLKPLARPWREELLRMVRGQIEVDQRVTLAEWIYYMLLRSRLLPADSRSWRGDEAEANAAESVRWVTTMLARCAGEPDLRGQRVSNEIIQQLGLSRTGQSYPPLDVGGLQAVVASLRQLSPLQRPLLMRHFVKFLSAEAPIEARDFLRVLALVIDCPIPEFRPIVLVSPPGDDEADTAPAAASTRRGARSGIAATAA